MGEKTEVIAGLLALLVFLTSVTLHSRHPSESYAGVSAGSFVTKSADADSVKTDPETGLAIDDQLMLVKGQCTACHSSKLILQSRFSREKWIERIRWMQRTQNLWDLGESEPAIVAYLTKHYGPTDRSPADRPFDGRRESLDAVKWQKPGN